MFNGDGLARNSEKSRLLLRDYMGGGCYSSPSLGRSPLTLAGESSSPKQEFSPATAICGLVDAAVFPFGLQPNPISSETSLAVAHPYD